MLSAPLHLPAPHFKSTPNKTKIDNYGTKGNVNPYTGKKGHKEE